MVEAVVGPAAIGAGVAAVTAGVAGGSGYTCTSPPDMSCTERQPRSTVQLVRSSAANAAVTARFVRPDGSPLAEWR